MMMRQWALAAAFSLCVANLGFSQVQTPIDAALRKLQSSSFVQREMGRKQLEAIGIPALEALRRATKSADTEAKRRLEELIRNFEEQVLTKRILTPKEVHLKIDGVSVQEGIAELAKISGYPLQFLGDATKLADKKITLDTGATSFWQAFDQLCDRAGLMERIDFQANPGQINVNGTPAPGPIVVTPRGNEKSFVSYAGAVKCELRVSRMAGAKEMTLTIIVSAEPRLAKAGLVATPRFEKLIDQLNRSLSAAPELSVAALTNAAALEMGLIDLMGFDSGEPLRRHVRVRVKDFDASGKQLKEAAGKLTFQLDLQNEILAKVEKILEAGGKSVDGANGGALRVASVKKQANGEVELQVALENLTPSSSRATS